MKATMKIRTMAAGAVCLCAALSASATEWTYSASGTTYTITDGHWTLNVSSFDKASGTIKFGNSNGNAIAVKSVDKSANGVLDLRDLVVTDGTDSTSIKSVEVGKQAFSSTNIVEFYCNIIGVMDAGGYCFAQNANLTRLEIGGSAEMLPSLITRNDTALKDAKFDFPNLRQGGSTAGQSILSNASPDPIDIATISPPGVTNVVNGAYAHSQLGGDLVLTNVMAIGDGAFNQAVLTNVTLTGSLAALPVNAFKGATITNIVLDLPNLTNVAATAFSGQTKIHSVEILSAFADMGQITNILKDVKTSQSWQRAIATGCRVYISKRQWTKKAREEASYFTSEFDADETKKIAADPTLAKTYGMIIVGSLKKAFVVDKPSPRDKIPGVIVIIR